MEEKVIVIIRFSFHALEYSSIVSQGITSLLYAHCCCTTSRKKEIVVTYSHVYYQRESSRYGEDSVGLCPTSSFRYVFCCSPGKFVLDNYRSKYM